MRFQCVTTRANNPWRRRDPRSPPPGRRALLDPGEEHHRQQRRHETGADVHAGPARLAPLNSCGCCSYDPRDDERDGESAEDDLEGHEPLHRLNSKRVTTTAEPSKKRIIHGG